MIAKALGEISTDDLQRLVEERTQEGLSVEFKAGMSGKSESEVKEFLADVSSFANARGGDLLYGVEELDGLAVALSGVVIPNQDAFQLEWSDRIRAGIEPRLPRVEWAFVPVHAPDTFVAILRIWPSSIGPHRVVYRGHGHFYSRAGTAKYRLDVPELRQAFLQTERLAERIRDFVVERVARIASGRTPATLDHLSAVVIHVIPLSAFTSSDRLNLTVLDHQLVQLRPPGGGSGHNPRRNLDGYLNERAPSAYTQIFDTGIVEGVETLGKERIYWPSQDAEIEEAVSLFLDGLRRIGIEPPIYVVVSLCGVRGLRAGRQPGFASPPSGYLDEVVTLPEVAIEEWPESVPAIIKPIFDRIWNGLGAPTSPSYSGGKWAPRR